MKRFTLTMLLACGFCSFAFTAKAATVTWPENGHAYEYVPDKVSWPDAKVLAEQRTPPPGFQTGHLVTISNTAENSFLVTSFMTGSEYNWFGWGGFTDELVEGEWRWIDDTPGIWQDPDNFANPIQTAYVNWLPGEPNNMIFYGIPENYLLISATGWNDGQGYNPYVGGTTFSYFVEYSPVPEPSSLALILFGAISSIAFVWKRKRSK